MARKRKEQLTETFTIVVPLVVEIRANSRESAEAIMDRSEIDFVTPQDTKNGPYFLRSVTQISFEDLMIMLSESK